MTKLTYIVLSCRELAASKSFYEALGLSLQKEKHGAGPIHFSFVLSGVVIELYPARSNQANAADPRRIGITVEDVAEVAAALEALNARRASSPASSNQIKVCFFDPDGRTIEIREERSH